MSHWKAWQLSVKKVHRPLFLKPAGLANRNYHVINQLQKRPEINRILAVDLIPFTSKRSWRVYYESILGKVPGDNVTGKFTVSRNRTKITKANDKTWVYTTCRNLPKKDNPDEIWHELLAVMDELNFQNRLLWSYFPMYALPFQKLSGTKVFDTVDDWREHPYYRDRWQKILDENYETIDRSADAIFTVSESLKKSYKTNQNVHWIPNGIDFEHYKNPDIALAEKLKKIKKPVIGYLGVIENRLDFDLLIKISEKFPQASLVLAGPVWKQAETKALRQKKNVHFLGPISYHDLPELYHYFDIGIIPHRVNEFTKSMNPLKMYEYLACGLPVVTTPVAGTEQFSDLITVAADNSDFLKAIAHYLKSPGDSETKQARQQAVAKHSWDERLDRMFSIIKNAK